MRWGIKNSTPAAKEQPGCLQHDIKISSTLE